MLLFVLGLYVNFNVVFYTCMSVYYMIFAQNKMATSVFNRIYG